MRTVVVLVLLATACKKPDAGEIANKPPPAKVTVKTRVAVEAPAPDVLVLTGTVAANQRAEVTADTQGKVVNVLRDRGDTVKLGEPVVQLDVRNAALSAKEASANLSAARAQKELADQECARTKTLFEKGAITASEYDRQMTSCRAALDEVAATQARADMMAKTVSDGLVRAPFAGVIDDKDVSPGEWVAPGKPLFTLVDRASLKIELSVPEIAVSQIALQQRVLVEAVAYPGKRFGATITRIGAEIGRTRSLIVEATLDPKSELVPGMFAEAHVVVKTEPRVVVPRSAVVQRDKRDHVFVVGKNGEIDDRIVHLGDPPSDDTATIKSGVAAGEKIVLSVVPSSGAGSAAPPSPWDALADGTPVTEAN